MKRFEEFMDFWIEFYEHLFVITFCFHIGFYCLSLNKKHFTIQLLRFHTLIVYGPPIRYVSVRRQQQQSPVANVEGSTVWSYAFLCPRKYTHSHTVVVHRLLFVRIVEFGVPAGAGVVIMGIKYFYDASFLRPHDTRTRLLRQLGLKIISFCFTQHSNFVTHMNICMVCMILFWFWLLAFMYKCICNTTIK